MIFVRFHLLRNMNRPRRYSEQDSGSELINLVILGALKTRDVMLS